MKYKVKCTYCVPQVMNVYPDRRKNPIHHEVYDFYIEVDTLEEEDAIDMMNYHMERAYHFLTILEKNINSK